MSSDSHDFQNSDNAVGVMLNSLSVAEPPENGWDRIMATQLAQEQTRSRRYRRYLQLSGVAALMVITLVTGFLVGQQSTRKSLAIESSAMQALMIESRILEQQLQILTTGSRHDHNDRLLKSQQTQLTRLDAQLSAAYEQGLDDTHVSRLWQQRATLISNMISTVHAARRTVEQI